MAEVHCPQRLLDRVTPSDEGVADVLHAHTLPGVNACAARAGCWVGQESELASEVLVPG